jgi:outer membrane protein OmpA-like peptidoglycan-associated protein
VRGEAFDSTEGVWPAFSDLLAATTLLFVVLFAVIAVPSIKIGVDAKATQLRLDALYARFQAREKNDEFVTTRLVDHLRITIGETSVWKTGQFTLRQMDSSGRETLLELAAVLNAKEVRDSIDQIHVVGHTSSEGSDAVNWDLSSKRAGVSAHSAGARTILPARSRTG